MPGSNAYLAKLTRLKRAPTRYGKAPHKPILLITLLELMDSGYVTDNCFYPGTELVGVFQENWSLLVSTANQPDFTLPFYHLQSEKVEGLRIWELVTKPGQQFNAYIGSINTLVAVVDHGRLAEDLFLYLSNKANREYVRQLLIKTYFPDKVKDFEGSKAAGSGYFHDLEAWILNVPEAKTKTVRIETEEDVYVRSGLFKRLVPQVYDQTCAISGMQLGSTFGHSFVDACHIVPFSVSHDDRVTNGLALCPNIHRAFDRGLIALDDHYQVLLSAHVRENAEHQYSLSRFHRGKVKLPASRSAWPDLDMLRWHRENLFKG